MLTYDGLCRREFSASPHVYTFLSTVAGTSFSTPCFWCSHLAFRPQRRSKEATCQICSCVSKSMESVVRTTSVSDIMDGSTKIPFTTRSTWLAIEPKCPDLKRICAHLRQGTRPSCKATNIKDIKHYLNVAAIASDGLLVVKRNKLFVSAKELS